MGPPSYMWSVVDRNVVMRLMTVLNLSRCNRVDCLGTQTGTVTRKKYVQNLLPFL